MEEGEKWEIGERDKVGGGGGGERECRRDREKNRYM